MKYIRLFLLTAVAGIVLLVAFQRADEVDNHAVAESKINGISFVAPSRPVGIEALEPIKKVNANWTAITPYAFGKAGAPDLRFNVSRQWWGEREAGVVATVQYAHELGMNVMLKPHVWVRGQGWAGEFEMKNEADWKEWEQNYRDYIISYAQVADSLNVELFCIGTEYRLAVRQRPEFWHGLIKEVKGIYDGKLTYAANWDNYQNVGFWDDLDYIGVDSYFDISENKTPSVAHLTEKWGPVKGDLQSFANGKGKPILFTEFGYKSVDFTADGHWKYNRDERVLNLQAQANAYQAVFKTFWNEPWFAGGFLWKWFDSHAERGGPDNTRFTPQNKPAEETIRKWYGRDK